MSNLQGQYGSASTGELEVKAEGSVYKNSVIADRMLADSNKLGQLGSSSIPVNFKSEISESSYEKSHSLLTEFNYDHERTKSPLKSDHCQGEMDELHGSYFHKSSFQFLEKTSQSERGTEDSAHSQESLMTLAYSQTEKMDSNSDFDRLNTTCYEEEVRDDNEPKNGNYYSRNSPLENGSMDMAHSHPRSPRTTPKHSASPLTARAVPASPERSPCMHQSPNGHEPLSSQEGIQAPSHPPVASRHRESSSPDRSSRQKHRYSSSPRRSDQGTEVSYQDHLSPSVKRKSASPERSRHKDGSSLKRRSEWPKAHKSPQKHRRQDRPVSRSPIRRRDSSPGFRRDHHGRSRSRSPRRRYSPRRRSPPPRYHSSVHSPRRRPWAPPPNRRTGLGKPGNNLFVAGFNFLTTERDLERKFSRFGHVRDVRIVRDKRSGDSRGFGFLSLERDEDADAAIRALDETEWDGRIILVEKTKSH